VGAAADDDGQFTFESHAPLLGGHRLHRLFVADGARRALQEVQRLGGFGPAVLGRSDAEVVPQADDLARRAGRQPGVCRHGCQRQARARGL